MTRTEKFRNCEVIIDEDEKLVYIEIFKPMKSSFSISDKVYEFLKKGYRIKVMMPNSYIILADPESYYNKEEVKTKYEGHDNWYRYWFSRRGEIPNG